MRLLGIDLTNYRYQRGTQGQVDAVDTKTDDVGEAIPQVGGRAPTVLAELLELAPWSKVLYSSDAFGLAELYLSTLREQQRYQRDVY